MKLGNNNGVDWQWSAVLTERIPQGWLEKAGWSVATESTTEDPADLLHIHAQRLLAGDSLPNKPTAHFTLNGDETADLTHLAEQLAYIMRPAFPNPHFRKELRQALLSAHRQQAARRRIFAHPLFEKGVVDRSVLERLEIDSPWFWQVAAGVPVLIAIAAIIWRYTHRSTEQVEKVAV